MLNFRTPGELWVTMVDYLKVVMEDFPEVITGWSTSPEDNRLFWFNSEDERKLLDKERATSFLHMVTQLLLFMSGARKYIKMDIAFLYTQVNIPGKDDCVNLVRMLRYIIVTLHISLILRSNGLSVIKWWVSVSFLAHPYCKRHTG